MSRKVHEDMYLFNTIMKFTNRYDVANRVYDELFGKVWTIDKIEKLPQPTLIKLDDLRCTIRKGNIRKNINTEREIRHQRILNEMRDIESCIDYKEDRNSIFDINIFY